MRTLWTSSLRSILGMSVAVAMFGIIIGCDGKKPAGTVTGKVSYKGEPLKIGFVNYMDTKTGAAAIGEVKEGTYTLDGDIDVGTYKVYIQPPVPEQLPPGKVSKRPPFNVPPKFQDPAQTPISKEVKVGANTIDVDFKD